MTSRTAARACSEETGTSGSEPWAPAAVDTAAATTIVARAATRILIDAGTRSRDQRTGLLSTQQVEALGPTAQIDVRPCRDAGDQRQRDQTRERPGLLDDQHPALGQAEHRDQRRGTQGERHPDHRRD